MSAPLLHLPEGDHNPYEAVLWSRHPLEPHAGETFRVGVRPRGNVGMVGVEWESGGDDGRIELDHEGDAWTAELGPFTSDCRYRFVADGAETDWFSVPMGRWEPISFSHIHDDGQRIHVLGDRGAALTLTVDGDDSLAWSLGPGADQPGGSIAIRLGGWSARVEPSGTVVLERGEQDLRLGASRCVHERGPMAWRLSWALDPVEHLFGTGERFDALDQRGRSPDVRVYEQYKGQGSRTYFPVPWLLSTRGYGMAIDAASRVQFDLGATRADEAVVTVPSSDGASGRWYFGSPKQVLGAYSADQESRSSFPMWAFGPWMSGNEWDSEHRIREVVERTDVEGMPATVIVIEAWSDEATFYLFNDTEHDPVAGSEPVAFDAMRHGGRWPHPKALVEWLHERGIRILLWQIPVLKDMDGNEQHRRDVAFADEAAMCVGTSSGDAYRNRGWWFPGSRVIDFTRPEASAWWFAKRAYLLDDIGVDGFKTDGGEHLWGSDVVAADGATGDAAANAYPTHYLAAYHHFMSQHGHGQPITFSRAGFTGSQGLPGHWAGDEDSTWQAYRASLIAGLSAGASGIAFWGWDLAGFSGELPSSELYKRSTAMAAFCPIMQYHSEHNQHRQPLADRTPWNVSEHRGDPEVNTVYRFYARLRMNLVPYLFGLAMETARTGLPMMRAMAIEFPGEQQAAGIEDQFMLGSGVLVAPIVEPGTMERTVYLPAGEWTDLWTGTSTPGGWVAASAPVDVIPVYLRAGSAIPLWMPDSIELGAAVGLPGEGPGRLVVMVIPGRGESTLVDPVSAQTWSVAVEPTEDALIIRTTGAPAAYTLWLRGTGGAARFLPIPGGDSSLRIGLSDR